MRPFERYVAEVGALSRLVPAATEDLESEAQIVYAREIEPLMAQVVELCGEVGIALVATFLVPQAGGKAPDLKHVRRLNLVAEDDDVAK